MSAPVPLRQLDGELSTIDYGDGVARPCVMFTCPVCKDGHAHVMPYGPEQERVRVGNHDVIVWKHTGGSTIDDITLSPSYLVRSCNLHGYVRGGQWVPC